jgi:hypothetical protein
MSKFPEPRYAGAKSVGPIMVLLFALLAAPMLALAQEPIEEEHLAVFEAGAASEHSSQGGAAHFGGTLGVETTPIENWLEVEFGVAALRSSGLTEYSSDLVFKMPFRLSDTAEFMVGLGPFVSRTLRDSQQDTSHGVEVALDFMFWPSKDFGWYLEPSWSRASASGERTIGLTVGLLFGWR